MQRMDLAEHAPEAIQTLLQLSKQVRAGIEPRLHHLVDLRASMINGCAYCVDMHSREGIEDGDTAQRLFAVAAWRESTLFTERERTALELTDALTRLGEGGVSDELWERARSHFTDKELAHLVLAIGVINVWNRNAISVHKETPLAAH
ncbi:MAG TPA: carboxymuconolactone decarboxylase family protein [Pseudonocardiaceae bacterium]